MSELEDKLNSILSSPAEMEKIMGLARSLSDSMKTPDDKPADVEKAAFSLGDLDPKMFRLMSRLMGEYSGHSDDKTALLTAMKPYLREERQKTVDRAVELARLAKLARIAFTELSGDEK